MKVYSFKCPSCGYESKHPIGTPEMDQILTDVNNDFAQYRLFVCRKEHAFVHVDVQDAQFDNKCPSDKSELEPVDDDLENVKCPRCGKALEIEEMKPLAAGDSTSG